MTTESLRQLATCLAGVFQNQAQALAAPAWFVHIRLWIHPVPVFATDSCAFFLEQASAAYPQPPYRQRLLRLQESATGLTAEYYALQQPLAFQGATQSPERLRSLTVNDLQPLTGSRLRVTPTPEGGGTRFQARQAPGERCLFQMDGNPKAVELGFDAIAMPQGDVTDNAFWMYDKGIDLTTGQATWGALNGPFKLIKQVDWSDRLVT